MDFFCIYTLIKVYRHAFLRTVATLLRALFRTFISPPLLFIKTVVKFSFISGVGDTTFAYTGNMNESILER